jgi:hypothetical protein
MDVLNSNMIFNLLKIEIIIIKYEKCIITSFDKVECEAAHIVPVKDNGNY